MPEANDRLKAVDLAISQIERQFGKGSIMKLGDRPTLDVPVISTTSLSVDYALGVGGVPRGRVMRKMKAGSLAELVGLAQHGKRVAAVGTLLH